MARGPKQEREMHFMDMGIKVEQAKFYIRVAFSSCAPIFPSQALPPFSSPFSSPPAAVHLQKRPQLHPLILKPLLQLTFPTAWTAGMRKKCT